MPKFLDLGEIFLDAMLDIARQIRVLLVMIGVVVASWLAVGLMLAAIGLSLLSIVVIIAYLTGAL